MTNAQIDATADRLAALPRVLAHAWLSARYAMSGGFPARLIEAAQAICPSDPAPRTSSSNPFTTGLFDLGRRRAGLRPRL